MLDTARENGKLQLDFGEVSVRHVAGIEAVEPVVDPCQACLHPLHPLGHLPADEQRLSQRTQRQTCQRHHQLSSLVQ